MLLVAADTRYCLVKGERIVSFVPTAQLRGLLLAPTVLVNTVLLLPLSSASGLGLKCVGIGMRVLPALVSMPDALEQWTARPLKLVSGPNKCCEAQGLPARPAPQFQFVVTAETDPSRMVVPTYSIKKSKSIGNAWRISQFNRAGHLLYGIKTKSCLEG